MSRRPVQAKHLRTRIAHEAARLIAEHGISDYYLAKRKAAASMGVVDQGALPRNTEIEAALRESQRLFAGAEHFSRLAQMRRSALVVMADLAQFEPRVVGALVAGTIAINTPIELHLFSEPPEVVAIALIERGLDHSVAENRLRTGREQHDVYPAFVFDADEFTVEATVFPMDGVRQAPLSPVDGRPMRRLSAAAIAELLDAPLDFIGS